MRSPLLPSSYGRRSGATFVPADFNPSESESTDSLLDSGSGASAGDIEKALKALENMPQLAYNARNL